MTNAPTVTAGPKPVGRLHLTHVDGLRAVAALTVYVNHAYAQAGFPGQAASASGVLRPFAYFMVLGHLAVSVFIVISGFCLALPVVAGGDQLRGGTTEFFKRRIRRILPPYYAALALSLLLIATVIGEPTGTLWDVPIQVDWVATVSHVLLLQDLFGTGKINYVFWSIAVEWHIYFVFPLLVLATARFGVVRVALVALLAGYALRFGFDGTRVERANPHYLGLFCLGMIASYVACSPRYEKWRHASFWPWLAGGAALIACLLIYVLGHDEPERYFHFVDLPVGIFASSLLVYTTMKKGSLTTRALDLRGTVWVGTFSYSLYLVHAPLLQLMWQYGLSPFGMSSSMMFIVLMTAGLAAVLVCSYGFFLVFERPFMRSKQKVAASPRASASPATL